MRPNERAVGCFESRERRFREGKRCIGTTEHTRENASRKFSQESAGTPRKA